MKKITLGILSLLLTHVSSSPALAGAEGGAREGHGGDAVVCRLTDGTETVELFDYYEARITRGQTTALEGASYVAQVEDALAKLGRYDANYASTLFQNFKRLLQPGAIEFKSRDEIPEIDDATSWAPIGDGCRKAQLAKQKSVTEYLNEPTGAWLTIDRDLWNAMTPNGRAGLILHEIIYREEIRVGVMNSDGVRFFNALLSSPQFSTLSNEEFLSITEASLRGLN